MVRCCVVTLCSELKLRVSARSGGLGFARRHRQTDGRTDSQVKKEGYVTCAGGKVGHSLQVVLRSDEADDDLRFKG